MDGTVCVQDLIALNAGGKYGTAATDAGWWQGGFNYDGRVNVTDLISPVSSGLYGAGSFMPVSSSGAVVSQASRLLNSQPRRPASLSPAMQHPRSRQSKR